MRHTEHSWTKIRFLTGPYVQSRPIKARPLQKLEGSIQCANCNLGHLLRECPGPTDSTGRLPGCGKCNTLEHTLVECPKKLLKSDVRFFVFKSRHNKAPVYWDEDLKDPSVQGFLLDNQPWTAEFSLTQPTPPFSKAGSIVDLTWTWLLETIPLQIHLGVSLRRFRHAKIFDRPSQNSMKSSEISRLQGSSFNQKGSVALKAQLQTRARDDDPDAARPPPERPQIEEFGSHRPEHEQRSAKKTIPGVFFCDICLSTEHPTRECSWPCRYSQTSPYISPQSREAKQEQQTGYVDNEHYEDATIYDPLSTESPRRCPNCDGLNHTAEHCSGACGKCGSLDHKTDAYPSFSPERR